ncbi:MAG: hypothetical protein A2W90_13935 [Bacteroidetes bacterium GWF2_42_66]|nr:MAG: hypothetical protein A2W92_14650 [Bacteroidetes bacterium GWA2_42_15]OFX97351.1 MAG: hypothetical protein A2W89_01110 [Bacteroidetes bacterium GWE2_42_39]OFY39988.1 MAG: hypothetical protein A2W90_13935 [Bacteroidetes bacterium GWF2_42_66]HBL78182.1 hypothetical protein [Prolixibacteraceae bacterium]HCR89460.1 hypothetical protein [Prolixibacteraceae bacterium]
MITENDRDALIEYRLNQAFDTIELVRFLLAGNKLTIAINRIYYGMYYALTALALKNKFETSKHGQLIGWFNREFIASKKVDSKYGRILRNAYQNRTKSDYDAFVLFSIAEVESMLEEMMEFIGKIKQILEE